MQRFGNHKEFMQAFEGVAGVHYHAYTAYQLLSPDIYTAKYAQQQSQSFQYYSERGWRGFGKGARDQLLRHNEESDHDSDRRKTFLLARQQYGPYFAILYPDRDEFLFCSWQSRPGENNHTSQRLLQHRHFRMLFRRTQAQSIVISRVAHSARYPRPDFLSKPALSSSSSSSSSSFMKEQEDVLTAHRNSNTQVNIQEHLSACLKEGYANRDMVQLWECFSEAKMENTKSKSGEILLTETCPFVGVHNTGLRCKCKRAKSKKCHYLHLNTVYFKPHKIYEKYGNAIYEPLSDMINLWN
jgi:hypothetical protein